MSCFRRCRRLQRRVCAVRWQVVGKSLTTLHTANSGMLRFRDRMNTRTALKLIGPSSISCFFVFFTHLALSMVPRLFPTFSLITLFSLSALALLALAGLGKFCRRYLGVKASAPAFVFFNILFVWGVYVTVVRQAVTSLMDIVINVELAMLIFGLCRILSSDPGLVKHGLLHSNELTGASDAVLETQHQSSGLYKRVRYCGRCKAYIKGFDHHCPALGNCIGEETLILDKRRLENALARDLVVSTMVFSTLQVIWQVLFLSWHIYCVCVNIRTEEWINWKKYPDFQLVVHSGQFQPGQYSAKTVFKNPYNRGIMQNIKELLAPE